MAKRRVRGCSEEDTGHIARMNRSSCHWLTVSGKTQRYVCITTIIITITIMHKLAQFITTLTHIQEKPASNLAHKTEHRL
jgi:hypothetical protein